MNEVPLCHSQGYREHFETGIECCSLICIEKLSLHPGYRALPQIGRDWKSIPEKVLGVKMILVVKMINFGG